MAFFLAVSIITLRYACMEVPERQSWQPRAPLNLVGGVGKWWVMAVLRSMFVWG